MIKRLITAVKSFIAEYKKEKWFKNTVIIIVCVLMAVCADRWRKWQDAKEYAEPNTAVVQTMEEPEEMSFTQEVWEESKFHFLVFTLLTGAMIVVKVRKALRLEQTERKIEKE